MGLGGPFGSDKGKGMLNKDYVPPGKEGDTHAHEPLISRADIIQ